MNFSRLSRRIFQNVARERFAVRADRNFSLGIRLAMRFVQYQDGSGRRGLGVLQSRDGGQIVSLSEADPSIPTDMVSFLHASCPVEHVKKIFDEKMVVLQSSQVKLLPCVTKPDKVICVGLNYKGHCDEQQKPYPREPFFFSKFPSTIVGPYDAVRHSPQSKALDWEVEMAVVVGKTCKNVPIANAYEYVFGYTIAQDISARDWQKTRNNGQWLIAKSMDTFCPLGSVLVHKDEIPDPHNLNIKCSINGVLKQDGSTEELIHRVDKLISFLSNLITLLPGDIILTGTPSGVGVFREPKEFLKVGDSIKSEIAGIGEMVNPVIADC